MSGFRGLPRHLRVDASPPVSKQLALFNAMGRRFAPYEQWEDYRAGMFNSRLSDDFAAAAGGVLGVEARCASSMRQMIRSWPIAATVNLTNSGLNRRAWVGQAACCFEVGATSVETKRAWWQLTESERVRANRCADEVIALWHTEQD